MSFYELLRKKACDEATSNKVVYVEHKEKKHEKPVYMEYTYSDIYDMVNNYIQNEMPLVTKYFEFEKRVHLIVDNSVESIVAIIAHLQCGHSLVLFNYKSIAEISRIEKVMSQGYLYPYYCGYIEKDNPNRDNRNYQYVNEFQEYVDDIYSNSGHLTETENETIVICSSGSEGKVPHFTEIDVNRLIKNRHKYGEKGSTFLSYIPCASISGLLTNLVAPLVNDCRVILTPNFDINLLGKDLSRKFALENPNGKREYYISYRNPELLHLLLAGFTLETEVDISKLEFQIENNKLVAYNGRFKNDEFKEKYISHGIIPDSVMLPRDIMPYLEKLNTHDIDLSNLKHIYLAGGSNSYEVIKKMRSYFPSLKPNIFENLYGATEVYGVICSCKERDLRTCYIDINAYDGRLENVIYTYDRKKYYRFLNGKPVELDKSGFVFNEITKSSLIEFFFQPYLSVSDKKLDYLNAGSDLSLQFQNGETQLLSDAGIYIENHLYILSRSGELIVPKVKEAVGHLTYYLSYVEAYFERVVGTKVYCVNNPDGSVGIYLNIKDYKFPELVELYRRCLECKAKLDNELNIIKVNYPVFLSDNIFPKSNVSGKVSKGKLRKFSRYAEVQRENLMDVDKNLRLLTSSWIEKLLKCYGEICGKLNENYRFTLRIHDDKLFFPMVTELGKLVTVVEFDDEKGEITYEINKNILFFTDEEFNQVFDVLSTCYNNASRMLEEYLETGESEVILPKESVEEEVRTYCLQKIRENQKV